MHSNSHENLQNLPQVFLDSWANNTTEKLGTTVTGLLVRVRARKSEVEWRRGSLGLLTEAYKAVDAVRGQRRASESLLMSTLHRNTSQCSG